jgi:SM-20-related protein
LSAPDPGATIDFLEVPNFLPEKACADLCAELRRAAGDPAKLLGGELQRQVRRATRVALPPDIVSASLIEPRFVATVPALQQRFGVTLRHFEPPQFLRYETGDFFVAHQDGNTPLIHDDSRFRKVSVVLFLSQHSEIPAPDTYGGGEFVLHSPWNGAGLRLPLAPRPGTFIAFRAETTHEVMPVTHGERFTVVSWFR